MRFVHEPLQIVRANLGPYLIINAFVYGVCLVGFGVALLFPGLAAAQVSNMEADGTAALAMSLLSNVWLFALVILGVNALKVGALSILLPSMIVPFAGLAIFGYQSFTIGLALAPTSESAWIMLIPHSLTWLIEFQAYALLALGAYLLGRSWIHPRSIGAQTRRQGYLRGLQQLGWLALAALALLIIGAIYEAFSLIYLIVPLTHLLLRG